MPTSWPCSGKADPMKLFMDKKLRITGDIMASQPEAFPRRSINLVLAVAARRGPAGGTALRRQHWQRRLRRAEPIGRCLHRHRRL